MCVSIDLHDMPCEVNARKILDVVENSFAAHQKIRTLGMVC